MNRPRSTPPSRQHAAADSAGKETTEWDSKVRGLGLRRRPGQVPVWILQCKLAGKATKRSLGPAHGISLAEARARAVALRSQLEGHEIKPLTLAEFAPVFLEQCMGRWAPATLEAHRWAVQQIVAEFGDRPVTSVKRSDVIEWYEHRRCDRSLSVFSALMLHAEDIGIRPASSNPCQGLRKKKICTVENYPAQQEYTQLGPLLRRGLNTEPGLARLVLFLALTGARPGEGRELTWAHVTDNGAYFPKAKGGPRTIPLPTPARLLLSRTPRHPDSPYVFARQDGQVISKAMAMTYWQRLRLQSAIKAMRQVDLRHGYGSTAVNNGEELRVVGALLGHHDYNSTLAYAHLSPDAVSAAAKRVSAYLHEKIRGQHAQH